MGSPFRWTLEMDWQPALRLPHHTHQCPRRTAFAFARGVTGHWMDNTAYTTTHSRGALLGSHQGAEKRMKCCCCENSPLSCDEIVDGPIAMSDGRAARGRAGLVPTSRRSLGIHPTRGWMRKKKEGKRGRDEGEGCFLEGGRGGAGGAGGYRLLPAAGKPVRYPPSRRILLAGWFSFFSGRLSLIWCDNLGGGASPSSQRRGGRARPPSVFALPASAFLNFPLFPSTPSPPRPATTTQRATTSPIASPLPKPSLLPQARRPPPRHPRRSFHRPPTNPSATVFHDHITNEQIHA